MKDSKSSEGESRTTPPGNDGDAPRVFDRPAEDHRWHRALEELKTDATWEFVARNWRMDSRVARAREEALLESEEFSAGHDVSGPIWKRQLRRYWRRALCRPAVPAATGPHSESVEIANGSNSLAGDQIPPHEQLIHASSLNGILWRLRERDEGALLDIEGTAVPRLPGGGKSWEEHKVRVDAFAEEINDGGLDTVRSLAGILCDALGETEPLWWAGFAQEVRSLVGERDAVGLCRALGLGHLEAGTWLLVWKYPMRLVAPTVSGTKLYRPTVVEARDIPYHFPTPSGLPYGITMSLTVPPEEAEEETGAVAGATEWGSCREVLHAPLRGEAASQSCACELLRIAEPPIWDNSLLNRLRRRHREVLQKLPAPQAMKWLDRHPEPSGGS